MSVNSLPQPILKYHKAVIYLPDLVRSQPHVTAEQRVRGAETPPWPVPFHCKPWVDGQMAGYTIRYGFFTPITIGQTADGNINVENQETLFAEAKVLDQIDSFAPGFFSFSTGYTLKTPPGLVSLILPAEQSAAGYEPLAAIIETDWFPKEIFLAAKAPPLGTKLTLEFNDVLARVLVVPRQHETEAVQMTADEAAERAEKDQEYRSAEKTTTSRWTAATGHTFTHLYKQRAKAFRRSLKEQTNE